MAIFPCMEGWREGDHIRAHTSALKPGAILITCDESGRESSVYLSAADAAELGAQLIAFAESLADSADAQ